MNQLIAGRSKHEWVQSFPLLNDIINTQEVVWINPYKGIFPERPGITKREIYEAEKRLQRFAPLLTVAFPETAATHGIIESPLCEVLHMQTWLTNSYGQHIPGRLLVKGDHALPVAGSIKARGGIYEVLKIAESLVAGDLPAINDYRALLDERFRVSFSRYSLAVGSTGNLGLSIGIMGAKLGFNVIVHMSRDAKQWKKDLLRGAGVQVVEHHCDYSKAVEVGRRECESNDKCLFIDDENSRDLFLGYSVAALRLQQQFTAQKILVDDEHPLFVYLPCGVGGGPGGITYALKMIYGEHVQCFFGEPTHSPCMLLGLMTGKHDEISVQDFGIDNCTDADGLAVGRPSRFVGRMVGPYVTGVYTVDDNELYKLLYALFSSEGIKLEPSALAGMYGPLQLQRAGWFAENYSEGQLTRSTHLVWATGGSLVPDCFMEEYINKGMALQTS